MAKLILWQRYFSLAALSFAFMVIALGAFTRLIDAGLGCPDWPGCYGHLTVTTPQYGMVSSATPFVAYKAWAEMIHRYCAGILSVLIAIVWSVLVIRFKREKRASLLALSFTLLALVVYQILLGRWTVTLQLLPSIVTQHLLGGFLIVATLGLCYENTQESCARNDNQVYFILALIGAILFLMQIFLGAWTSTHYAALSCNGFPFCTDANTSIQFSWQEAFQWQTPVGLNYEGGLLSEAARQTIQMVHRVGAAIVFIYWLSFFLIARSHIAQKALKVFYVILLLLVMQIVLGIANAVFALPLLVAILHNVTAAALLLSTVFLVSRLHRVDAERSSLF